MAQEHVEELKKARQNLVNSRRSLVSGIAKPGEVGDLTRLIHIQQTIEAIDQAIEDEKE